MPLAQLDRVLSLGQSDTIPDRLSRQVRVTNALALLGVVLAVGTIPLDAIGAPPSVVVNDLVMTALFASCWALNARGHRTASRLLLMAATNATLLFGVIEIGAVPELRSVFFSLVLLPFLVFSVAERGWLTLWVATPIAAYFVTGQLEPPPSSLMMTVNLFYAPALAFTMIIGGALVFARIERTAQDKLMRAQARAAQGARLVALGEMSSGIAHELRNPLAAIHLASSQIAARPDDPALVAQLGERVQRMVMRATRIIESLRSFARDASGDPCVVTPVERIIGDALELCGKRFADHGVDLTVSPVAPDLAVECRSVQLSQVLVNLLGNGYDAVASADERWIRIDARADGEVLELAVTDGGPGVPAEARLHIFEPFYTTKGPDRGTGLGLSLSRGLIEAHHGTLELDATAPHTRFVIRIPLTQPPA